MAAISAATASVLFGNLPVRAILFAAAATMVLRSASDAATMWRAENYVFSRSTLAAVAALCWPALLVFAAFWFLWSFAGWWYLRVLPLALVVLSRQSQAWHWRDVKKRRGLAPYTTEQWEIRRKLTYEVARDVHGAERYTGKNWGEPAILAFAAAVLRGKREEADRIKFEQIGPQEGPWVWIPESQALGGRKE